MLSKKHRGLPSRVDRVASGTQTGKDEKGKRSPEDQKLIIKAGAIDEMFLIGPELVRRAKIVGEASDLFSACWKRPAILNFNLALTLIHPVSIQGRSTTR